jgi:hypothetical protein
MLVPGWRFVSIPLAALIAMCKERKYRSTGRIVHPEVILRPPARARSCLGELRQPFPMQIGKH